MPLLLTEEQQMLQDAARGFLSENAPVSQLRALRDSQDHRGYATDLWANMADLGWAGIIIPESSGGIAFGYVGLGLVFQEMGRTLCAAPMLSTAAMAAEMLNNSPETKQSREILAGIAHGQTLVTLAVDESTRHHPERHTTAAIEQAGIWTVSGAKRYVLDGHVADHMIVAAHDVAHGGTTLLLVDAQAPGVHAERTVMIDSHPVAHVEFKDAPASALVAKPGQGQGVLNRGLDLARLCLAAELLGLSEAVFERTMAYLGSRQQFGVPIGSFQVLQHRAAQMYGAIELTRSAVLSGLQCLDSDSPDELARAASLAKAKAADTSRLVAAEGVQMHGGIGMTDDVDIGLFMKRSAVAESMYGDYNYHTDRYARLSGY